MRDARLQERLAVNGKRPVLCAVVHVEDAVMHCGKSMVRARMWTPDQRPDRSIVPSLMESVKAIVNAPESLEDLEGREAFMTQVRLY